MPKRIIFRFFTLLIACLMLLVSSQPAITAPNQTTRISVASSGEEGNDRSRNPAISADGRFVAFLSKATNLVVGGTNGSVHTFVHDRQTGETTHVSVDSAGVQGNGDSYSPAISADGRFVAFHSDASNLVAGDDNGKQDVFVHDRQTGETKRVSVNSAGVEGEWESRSPAISADGRFVAFLSFSTNLVDSDTNSAADIFVHDRLTLETTRVSVNSAGVEGNMGSTSPAISADGRFVAFHSEASNLVAGDDNGMQDVFVHDRDTKQTTRVSIVHSSGVQANGYSYSPAISADGRFVAFWSMAYNLVAGDTNGRQDVFVHDRQTGDTIRVSVASDGTQGDGDSSGKPSISADGYFVAFTSDATNLVVGDTNGLSDIFVHNRLTGETIRASVASDGTQGIGGSSTTPSISADGRFVAFRSIAINLVPNDNNLSDDIFVRGLVSIVYVYMPLIIR